MIIKKPLSLKEYYSIKRDGAFMRASFEDMKAQHRENIKKLKEVQIERSKKDRPIYICVLHGSGRHPEVSCAKEVPNSKLLLMRGLELAKKEWTGIPFETQEFVLREMTMEVCNGCYSTSSALCHFSCTCWPGDDISTKIYPAIMKADIVLISTPVNQGTAHSQIWNVMQRLISLDGGYFVEEMPMKDQKYRSKAIQVEKENPRYDARLFGKIWAYFVSSKDYNNEREMKTSEGNPLDVLKNRFEYMDYLYGTVGTLAYQAAEFGGFHAEPYFVVAASNPDIGLSQDKAELQKNFKAQEESKQVVFSALRQAEKFIKNPPKLLEPDRVNRS